MRPLNVAVLPAWYPMPERPGWGIYVQDHVRAAALHHNMVVIADRGPRRHLRELVAVEDSIESGIRTLRVSYRPSRFRKLLALGYFVGLVRAVIRLRREGFRIDLVHGHIHQLAWAAVLLGAALRVPVVITEPSSEFARGLLGPGKRLRARLAFWAADLVCPVTNSLLRDIKRCGISARFRIVTNAVDTSVFFPGDRRRRSERRMLFVAQMTPVKGVPYLLEALASLQSRRNGFHLDLVGDGPDHAQYVALAEKLGLSASVTFHGHRSKPAIAELMRRSSFFVLPSVWETQSVVLIEALASGLPVVATAVGGVPEVVRDADGLLVPPADSRRLAEAIEHMLDHHCDYDAAALAASACERFSYEHVGRLLNEAYAEALAIHGRRQRAAQRA